MPDSTFLDWPFFEPRHKELALALRAWAAREVPAIVGHDHSRDAVDAACKALVAALGKDGWLKYAVPSPHGGHFPQLDVRSLAIIRETLGYQSGLADFAFAMQGLGSGSIALFGSDEQKAQYLPKVGAGTQIAAFALSEPEGGSDVAAMRCAARRDGNHFVIDGRKTWISNGGIAGHYVTFVKTGEGPGAKGISAFIVDADTPGLEIEARIDVIAPHPLATLRFKNCRVPASALLGNPGEGFKIAMATLDIFRTTVGAASLGFARRALDEAIAFAKKREAFGKTLAEFQLIQAKIAEMAVKIDTAALLIYRSAWTKDVKQARVTRESAMAKLYATDTAQEVIDEAVQIFGGQGVVSGAKVEELYREIRALRIYEGTSEIQKLVIAGQTMAAHAAETAQR
ncbi:MAG: acyl-CoA dehydrogenase family protein [Rhodospirillaceae bacterium]|nr:acyl-CoA dehydrogenase family protein [Rhodospirillaceae bacterium]